ncbi:MAG: TspO/MBR family protein [Methylocystis sp.]
MSNSSRFLIVYDGLYAITPVLLAAILGNYATLPNLAQWYALLIRPPFTPPNWLFGPVWSLLYILMALSFFRIIRLDRITPLRRFAISIFLSQILLNACWSFAFFSAHNPFAGLLIILPLEALILSNIIIVNKLDPIAARCLWPYAAWVAYAS